MIKYAPKLIKPFLEHFGKINDTHDVKNCPKCQRALGWIDAQIMSDKCVKCGKKLKKIKGERYTFYCDCMPHLRISIGKSGLGNWKKSHTTFK